MDPKYTFMEKGCECPLLDSYMDFLKTCGSPGAIEREYYGAWITCRDNQRTGKCPRIKE